MKGLLFYDAHLIGQHRHCNICGRQITDFKAWVYREDDIILFFCGDTARCRDEFLEINSIQDAEDTNVTTMALIQNKKIRNLVKCWADVNDLCEVMYDKNEDCIYSGCGSDDTDTRVSISFDDYHALEGLEHRKLYTITELCGKD